MIGMYYRFSRLSKFIIILNLIVTILFGIIHGINTIRVFRTFDLIEDYVEEHDTNRQNAIYNLRLNGEDVFVGYEITTVTGFAWCVFTVPMIILYAKKNSFIAGFFAAAFSLFISLIGGFLMFYVFFSSKREIKGDESVYSYDTEWNKYVHKRQIESQ